MPSAHTRALLPALAAVAGDVSHSRETASAFESAYKLMHSQWIPHYSPRIIGGPDVVSCMQQSPTNAGCLRCRIPFVDALHTRPPTSNTTRVPEPC